MAHIATKIQLFDLPFNGDTLSSVEIMTVREMVLKRVPLTQDLGTQRTMVMVACLDRR